MVVETASDVGDVGIVLVHGIGSQLNSGDAVDGCEAGSGQGPGDPQPAVMLNDFGQALVAHIRHQGERRGYTIEPKPSLDDEIQFRISSIDSSADWLIREASWAKELPRPKEAAVAAWAGVLAPWLLLRYGASPLPKLRRDRSKDVVWALWFQLPRGFRAASWMGICAALIIFVAVPEGVDGVGGWAWLALLAVTLPRWGGRVAATYWSVVVAAMGLFAIPIRFALCAIAALTVQVFTILAFVLRFVPGFRNPSQCALKRLERTVGDAYLFLAVPNQREAIIAKVVDQITATSTEAERLVVVAHSQGSAIVDEALQRMTCPENLVAIHTLGAGFSKLGHLAKVERKRAGLAVGTVACWSLLVVTVIVARRSGAFSGLFVAGLGVTAWVAVARSRWATRDAEIARGLRAFSSHAAWFDVSASHDLVPDYSDQLGEARQSLMYNRSSFRFDHTTYAENPAVLDHVVRSAALETGQSPNMSKDEFDALVWQRSARSALWRFYSMLVFGILLLIGGSFLPSLPWGDYVVALAGVVVTRAVWLRWDRKARGLETTETSTVPVDGLDCINPLKWYRLDPRPLAEVVLPPEARL